MKFYLKPTHVKSQVVRRAHLSLKRRKIKYVKHYLQDTLATPKNNLSPTMRDFLGNGRGLLPQGTAWSLLVAVR